MLHRFIFWAFCLFVFEIGGLNAQVAICHTSWTDASGYDIAPFQTGLGQAACELRDILPAQYREDFQVYSASFYVFQEKYDVFSYPQAFDSLRQTVSNQSTYYVLVAWQNDSKGLYQKFFVDLRLPKLSGTDCPEDLEKLAKAYLSARIERAYEAGGRSVESAYPAETTGLSALSAYLENLKDCCEQGGSNISTCITCSQADNKKAFLTANGFRAVSIQNIGTDNAPYSAPEVDNRAKLLFTINDLDAVDLGNSYEPVIAAFNAQSTSIKIIITRDSNMCTPVWDSLWSIAESNTYDVVYWHHIHEGTGIGDHYLFSKAIFHDVHGTLPDSLGGQFRNDSTAANRLIATNLVAALGAAATDFMMQVLINYIFCEDIETGEWGKAVERVDYYSVAKSGLLGLFGVNSKIQLVASALADATRTTLAIAKYYEQNPPTPQSCPSCPSEYTLRWAAKDFSIEFLKNLVAESLGARVGEMAGKAFGKTKQISFPGWCKIARVLNKNLGTLIPGCFVAGTLVAVPSNYTPIDTIRPGDWVLSDTSLSPFQFVETEKKYGTKAEKFEDVNDLWASANEPTQMSAIEASAQETLNIPMLPAYDFEEISPETWSLATLTLQKADGSQSDIRMLRPCAWFEAEGLWSLGDSTWLSFPEMGLQGVGRLREMQATDVDTRSAAARALLEKGYRPVLTTFRHKTAEVLYLRFTNGDRIGTTAPHPFWSLDRDGWVAAEKLHEGERVKTLLGETTVDTAWLVLGGAVVWNLEVKGAHNFFVGGNKIIVHNGCIEELLKKLKNVIKLAGSSIPKRLAITTGNGEVFISASGLKHIHEKIFKPGFNAEADQFIFQLNPMHGENVFAFELLDLSSAVNDVLEDVIKHNRYGVKIFKGKWEMIFAPPADGQLIKLFHAVPN